MNIPASSNQVNAMPESFAMTRHAVVRANQRGYYLKDFHTIVEYGTETKDGYLLTRQDAARSIAIMKRTIADLERLSGSYIVTIKEKIITGYHTKRKQQSHLLKLRR